nr:hypothetical protein [Halomonas socia]
MTAILTEAVVPSDYLMLMIHAEEGGMETGIFEYTLGASEDGPRQSPAADAPLMSSRTIDKPMFL